MAEIESDVAAPAPQAPPEEEVRVCLFRISGDHYAVTVDVLAEIIIPQKIFPVPTTPSHVIGVMNLRGNIVPIVDIRPAMSLPPQTGVNQIAIIRRDQMTIGVVVDAVSEVAGVPKSSVMAMPAELGAKDPAVRSRSRFIKAVIRREDGVAALLDIDRLIEAIRLS